MALYVLAFTDAAVRVRAGVRPVVDVQVDGIHVICQRRYAVPPISDEVLREQHRDVLEIASRVRAVLPARFGALLERDEIVALVRTHEAALRAALDDVRDRVQMTTRVLGPAPAQPPVQVSSGKEYLERRRLLATPPLPDPVRGLLDAVRPFVVRERQEPGAAGLLATFYHLIAADDVPRYTSATRRMRLSNVVSTGPWPPFAFTPQVW